MQFNSFIFFIFFIIVLVSYYNISSNKRNIVLLISNYIFYSYFDYRFSILLLSLTTITYFLGNFISKNNTYELKRKFLITGVFINILILGIFKYLNFFSESFVSLVNLFGFYLDPVTISTIQPLGISFYIFQSLTWLFDNYYEKIDKEYNIIEFLTFSSFFPTVIAGPIERAHRLMPQIKNDRDFNKENIKAGFYLIVYGLFRKVLIGDTIGRMINHIFAEPEYFTSFEILAAILLYAIQIYNDFAGYSSIARGAAKMLGFDIMLNFKQPYFADSVTDFWRRWHISFSTWLRDYIFYPLQLKFRYYGRWGNLLAIILTFLLCGIWHGASWNFVLWGLLHGIYLSIPVLTGQGSSFINNKINNSSTLRILSIIKTFILVLIAWILFRIENWSTLMTLVNQLVLFSSGEFVARFIKIILSYYFVSFLLDYLEIKFQTDNILLKLTPAVAFGISLIVSIIVLSYLITSDKAPFIYARF